MTAPECKGILEGIVDDMNVRWSARDRYFKVSNAEVFTLARPIKCAMVGYETIGHRQRPIVCVHFVDETRCVVLLANDSTAIGWKTMAKFDLMEPTALDDLYAGIDQIMTYGIPDA